MKYMIEFAKVIFYLNMMYNYLQIYQNSLYNIIYGHLVKLSDIVVKGVEVFEHLHN